jgi:hypothetical protein
VDGQRRALIIASDEYDNPGLSRLKAPAADAEALANVLSDKEIGGFDVQVVHNEPAYTVEGHIEDLFAESQSDDLVLLHFSGHGLKSDSGELFFAARNTRPDRLGSTAVAADFVQRCMRSSRARSIVLFLDCCYGGAFGEGVAVRAAGSANVLESFPAGRLGGGRGRAVITASSAMEYAFEGNNLADEHQQQPSVFTSALVEGLTSGDADRDEDGLVSLNELYDYVFDRVRERNPKQTPGRDVELQGELYLARSRRRRLRPLPIPGDVAAALKSDNMFTRLGAVAELRARLSSADLSAALGAYQALVEVARSDIRYVQEAASEATGGAAPSPRPAELHFGRVASEEMPATQTIRLAGPPLAGALTVSQSEDWVTASVEPPEVHVSIDTTQPGSRSGTVTLTGPTGQVVIPVTAEVAAPPAPSETPEPEAPLALQSPAPASRAPTSPVSAPAISAPAISAPTVSAPAVPAADVGVVQSPSTAMPLASGAPVATGSAEAEPAHAGPPAETRRTAPGIPAASAPPSRPLWKISGITALVSGGLMLLCIVLPFQDGEALYAKEPLDAIYLLYLGLVVLCAGGLVLSAQWRIQALGGLVGASALGTMLILDFVNTLDEQGPSGLGLGFWAGSLAPLVLVSAGGLALTAARREAGSRFAAVPASDRASWFVVALALIGALILVPSALEIYTGDKGRGLQGLWLAVLAVAIPLTAVLVRPVLLGRWMLIGWALVCAAPVISIWIAWESSSGDGTSHGMWLVLLTLAAMVALALRLHGGRRPVGSEAPSQALEEEPAHEKPAVQPPTAAHGPAAASGPLSRPLWKFSGIAAIVSGALMLLCIVLPQQWDNNTFDNDRIKAIYLLYLGLVVLGVGGLALSARWRIQGLGAVIGASTVGTVVAFDMVNTLKKLGTSGLDVGFWVGFVAPLVLLAAGALAVAGARRETEPGFAAVPSSDRAAWVVLVLALAGALTLVPAALDTYLSLRGWGIQGLWVAVLAGVVPLTAVLARPILLGRWMLIGWSLACAAPVLATWLSWEDHDGTAHGMWFVLLTLAAMAGLAPLVHRGRP